LRIRIYSDLHLEFAPFVPPANDADVIVLAGDIGNGAAGIEWAREAFGGPVIYLAGNHEYYEGEFEAVQQAMGTAAREFAVTLLDCSEAVVDGVRFLGCTLWTDYSLVPAERPTVIEAARRLNPDYQLIRYGSRAFAPEDAIALCARHRAWLAEILAAPFPGKTVVITHFAPHPRFDRARLCGSSRQPRVRSRSGGHDGERGPVDPRTHPHVFRLPRARHSGDLQPARLSGRTHRVRARPHRGDLSF
jgi:3',5'-cyclic AMP phosphodiesterase CpdA